MTYGELMEDFDRQVREALGPSFIRWMEALERIAELFRACVDVIRRGLEAIFSALAYVPEETQRVRRIWVDRDLVRPEFSVPRRRSSR